MKLSLKFTAVGQARIHHSVAQPQHPGSIKLTQLVQDSDAAFINYEASLSNGTSHGNPSKLSTLEDLKAMGFNLLSLANNHASEGGAEGVIYTKEMARQLGFTTAGTGANLAEATAAQYREINGVRIALLAMDSVNMQTKNAIAGENGPAGVNPLRADPTGDAREYALNAQDVERNLQAVREAAQQADYVLVSFHEHLWPGEFKDVVHLPAWPQEWARVRDWKRNLAHQLIDAGATTVLSHGVPRACAVEMYRGCPILYSLGNFIFHSRAEASWPMSEAWNGFIVKAELRDGKMQHIRLIPIILGNAAGVTDVPRKERHYPRLLEGDDARAVLERVAAESRLLGTNISIVGEEGRLQ
jgi:poly-gamma-glutamate synthesis protein (capsule biosynthesis protein)